VAVTDPYASHEALVRGRLRELPPPAALAFGAAAARRIVNSIGSPKHLEALLERTWEVVRSGQRADSEEIRAAALELVPDEDSVKELTELLVGNAAAAIAYVMEAVAHDELERVVDASNRAIETAEALVSWSIPTTVPAADAYHAIEVSDLVGWELERQRADLEELAAGSPGAVERIRERACTQSIRYG
jgi:hypothetical protein